MYTYKNRRMSFFMNRALTPLQIQSKGLDNRPGSMKTGRNVQIIERTFFRMTWYLCLPESVRAKIFVDLVDFKWNS